MRLLCILCIVLILPACSITRRVHYGGYHVEWRSLPGKAQPVSSATSSAHHEESTEVQDSNEIEATVLQVPAELHFEAEVLTVPPSEDFPDTTVAPAYPLVRAFSRFFPLSREIIPIHDHQSELQKNPLPYDDGLRNFGWILVVVGALLLFGVLIGRGIFDNGPHGMGWLAWVIYILFGLIGLLLIYSMGFLNALLFSGALILVGLIFVGIGSI